MIKVIFILNAFNNLNFFKSENSMYIYIYVYIYLHIFTVTARSDHLVNQPVAASFSSKQTVENGRLHILGNIGRRVV